MRGSRGFSLLELVAVLSIFALVALIGVQAIQSTVRANDRLTGLSETSRELTLALSLLRNDLKSSTPRRFSPAAGGQEPALVVDPNGFALSVAGLARLEANRTGFGRVEWRHDAASGQLYRRVWTTLNPAAPQVKETLVLNDVQNLRLASYDIRTGWRNGFTVDPRNTDALPLGIKVELEHTPTGVIETLVSLR